MQYCKKKFFSARLVVGAGPVPARWPASMSSSIVMYCSCGSNMPPNCWSTIQSTPSHRLQPTAASATAPTSATASASTTVCLPPTTAPMPPKITTSRMPSRHSETNGYYFKIIRMYPTDGLKGQQPHSPGHRPGLIITK